MDRNKMKKKMIIMVFFLVVGIMVFGFVGSVKASDYYVAIDGNDTTGDGSFNNPWTSPEKAWRMADAGDTVYFRGGTYIISSQIWTKYYGCTGTEINPITFCNYPEECVIFNGTNLGVVFRIEKNWNIIKGINCTGGHSFFNFGYDLSVDGGRVENCIAYNWVSSWMEVLWFLIYLNDWVWYKYWDIVEITNRWFKIDITWGWTLPQIDLIYTAYA